MNINSPNQRCTNRILAVTFFTLALTICLSTFAHAATSDAVSAISTDSKKEDAPQNDIEWLTS
jgi:hypothetical protein